VDVEDDEDSRTVEWPGDSIAPLPSFVSFRDVDGLLRVGLFWTVLEPSPDAAESSIPGECEDMEVGVEVTLNGPGEYPVDGVVDSAYRGVGVMVSDVCVMY
jgi:hypothetical protein